MLGKILLIFTFCIIFILATLLFSPAQVLAASPNLQLEIYSRKLGVPNTNQVLTSVSSADKIIFDVTIKNITPNTTAENVSFKLDISSDYSRTHKVKAIVASSNTETVSVENTIILTDKEGVLTVTPGFAAMNWDCGRPNGLIPTTFVNTPLIFGNLDSNVLNCETVFSFWVNITPRTSLAVSDQNTSTSSAPSEIGSVNSNACNDSKPSNSVLKSVIRLTPESVKLTWDKNSSASNHFVFYGTATKSYLYSVKTGNTTNLDISNLDPNASYYFAITPINGCNSGVMSNELVSIPQAGNLAVNNIKRNALSLSDNKQASETVLPQTTPIVSSEDKPAAEKSIFRVIFESVRSFFYQVLHIKT